MVLLMICAVLSVLKAKREITKHPQATNSEGLLNLFGLISFWVYYF